MPRASVLLADPEPPVLLNMMAAELFVVAAMPSCMALNPDVAIVELKILSGVLEVLAMASGPVSVPPVVGKPPEVALASTNASVATSVELSPVVCVTAVVPVGSADAADRLVAAIVPVPATPSEAPVPTSIAADVFVPPVSAENAVDAVLVALTVTAPVPPVGVMVTLVPASI